METPGSNAAPSMTYKRSVTRDFIRWNTFIIVCAFVLIVITLILAVLVSPWCCLLLLLLLALIVYWFYVRSRYTVMMFGT